MTMHESVSVALLIPGLLGVGLVVGAVLTLLRARHRAARRAARWPAQGRILHIEGQRLHVLQHGPAEAPSVVLLHGASGNLRDQQISLMPGLLAARFRVTLFDRPGLGHSLPCMPGLTLRRQAELMDAACAELGLGQVVLCGQSFGGAVAACWAAYCPGRLAGLVLIAAPVFPWPPVIKRHFRLMARPVISPLIAWLLTAWMPERRLLEELAPQFAPDAMPDDYLARAGSALSLRPASLRADARQRVRLVRDQQLMVTRMPGLAMPVELVQGMRDQTVKPERHAEPLRAE
ncbi:alpha/beta fold hydrolase, partial [Oceanicola sp. S124]|uniref:alpha/beta fold hydrolase n=1 Tax=Oceanicola sp. S124 TaxID=1042378 RepID=UPI0002558D30